MYGKLKRCGISGVHSGAAMRKSKKCLEPPETLQNVHVHRHFQRKSTHEEEGKRKLEARSKVMNLTTAPRSNMLSGLMFLRKSPVGATIYALQSLLSFCHSSHSPRSKVARYTRGAIYDSRILATSRFRIIQHASVVQYGLYRRGKLALDSTGLLQIT